MRVVAQHLLWMWLAVPLSFAQSPSFKSLASFDQTPKPEEGFSQLMRNARAGDPAAQFRVGVAYESGAGTERNYTEAARWYQIAADHGNPAAQNNLGSMYARGLGVQKDEKEAARWYLRAAGERHPAAENNVGFIYAMGRGVPQSDDAAVSWYRRAAARGYPPAQTNLGLMYSAGRGVTQDTGQALDWYNKAAKQDYAPAQFQVGMMYFHGTGTAVDLSAGLKWLRKAADQGYSPAQNQLAYAYEHGQGVPQDYATAAKWYAAAADRGLPEAQHNVRVLHALLEKLSRGLASKTEALTGATSPPPVKTFANPQRPEAHRNILATKQLRNATKYLVDILETKPSNQREWRPGLPPRKSTTLTEAELRLMDVLWKTGPATVQQVLASLPESPALAYNSVLTTIRILEKKGYLKHTKDGRAHVYAPIVERKEAMRFAVRNLVNRFFGDSHELLVLNILENQDMDAEELKRLRAMIEQQK